MSTQSFSWFSNKGIAALALIGAVSYFLLIEHRQHVFQFLPYLILLLCPLMHVFMHRGHGGHAHGDHTESNDEAYRRGLEEGKKHSSHTDYH